MLIRKGIEHIRRDIDQTILKNAKQETTNGMQNIQNWLPGINRNTQKLIRVPITKALLIGEGTTQRKSGL